MNKIKIVLSLLGVSLVSCTNSSKIILTNSNLILKNTTDYLNSNNLDSIGTAKILVVPCVFEGEREFSSADLEKIEKGFFAGNLSNQGSYYSLKEYYSLSSLGKLSINGEVTDVLNIPYKVSTLEEENSYLPGVVAACLYESTYFSDEFLQEYDLNSDGYLDSVVFVYSSPTSSRTGSFWAWVANVETNADTTRPITSRHMWVGIDFFTDTNYTIDTHSIIHETGHLLGLRDYYPSDNYYLALGGHSMMDYNISDHDPYSKMLLDWAEPIYYDFKKNKKITLKLPVFEETNQFLLYNVNWNHSVMDEYLIFEYYTPTSLNYLDATYQYSTRPLGFTKPGIKIYHVDSRVAKCTLDEYGSLSFEEYVSSIPDTYDENIYYIIGANNNKSDSYTDASRQGRYKQIGLVENKEYNTLQSGNYADDDSLFYECDTFDSANSSYLLNGNFNNGESISLKMTVDELNDNYATITLEYYGD